MKRYVVYEIRNSLGNIFAIVFGVFFPTMMTVFLYHAIGAKMPSITQEAFAINIFVSNLLMSPLALVFIGFSALFSQEIDQDVTNRMNLSGLIKDVVIDKIESTDAHLRRNNHHTLSPEERQEAARVAFSGSEETGDQTVYLEKLQDHLRREHADKARAAAAAVAAGGGDGGSPTSSRTSTTTTADVLSSAPHAGEEHRKSIFHLAANPEVKKSLLLDHPEALGYHARDPTLAPLEESTLAAQHRLAGNNAASPQDVSKTRR